MTDRQTDRHADRQTAPPHTIPRKLSKTFKPSGQKFRRRPDRWVPTKKLRSGPLPNVWFLAHPSPHPKRHLDLFIHNHFSTANRRTHADHGWPVTIGRILILCGVIISWLTAVAFVGSVSAVINAVAAVDSCMNTALWVGTLEQIGPSARYAAIDTKHVRMTWQQRRRNDFSIAGANILRFRDVRLT